MERLLLEPTFAALEDARARMLTLARRTAEERIAAFLLDLADRVGSAGCRASNGGPLTFDLPLMRGEIAELLRPADRNGRPPADPAEEKPRTGKWCQKRTRHATVSI